MRASPDINHRRPRRAFSLLELLISITILAVMLLIFSNIYSHASRAWISGEGNAERRRSARALADFIGAELQEALLPVEGNDPKTHGNLQFIVNPSQLSNDYGNTDAIFWQSPLATEKTYGDIAEIGYFVKWDQNTPVLCRFFVNPSLMSGGNIVPNPNFLIYDTDPQKWITTAVVDQIVRPTDKAQGYKGLFAENVLGLWIRCYGLDGKELPRNFDSRTGYDYALPTAAGPVTVKRRLPASVRVSLAQLDWRSAKKLPPAADQVRQIVKSSVDASDFLAQFQTKANGVPTLAALLPGLRIYSTEVSLRNSR
ncbi:MAG: prepilin-type N-terminal cleavage/methylation domain-containing protein [Chthoniobacteraceae bacterium]|nr:prepilin-type N-terminal cleavage/methylation domain-containing protein [Chthoniobacteraceae bacterium]